MSKVPAYAATSAGARLEPFQIDRREPRPDDVEIDILYCGVCHSDLHQARDEWGGARFPMVPGHEIIGRVSRVGASVTKLALGEMAGVGCMVGSCLECEPCRRGMEQFCVKGCAFTYNSTEMDRVTPTFGGYSTRIVVPEHFAVKIPAGLDPAKAAPLLCAGITTYSPLRKWNCKKGDRVGVVGLGGLGHVAVRLAAAMGAEVTVLSTSRKKEADAKRLGAHAFAVTSEKDAFRTLRGAFDLLIDTVSASHDYDDYLGTLRPGGAMVVVGIPPARTPVAAFSLISGNRILAGSNIGGMEETQAMIDYCAKNQITADVEVIPIQKINEAYDRLVKNDVHYRFVIDISSFEK